MPTKRHLGKHSSFANILIKSLKNQFWFYIEHFTQLLHGHLSLLPSRQYDWCNWFRHKRASRQEWQRLHRQKGAFGSVRAICRSRESSGDRFDGEFRGVRVRGQVTLGDFPISVCFRVFDANPPGLFRGRRLLVHVGHLFSARRPVAPCQPPFLWS